MPALADLDQPTFKRFHLEVEKLIYFKWIEQLSASCWTRVALAQGTSHTIQQPGHVTWNKDMCERFASNETGLAELSLSRSVCV